MKKFFNPLLIFLIIFCLLLTLLICLGKVVSTFAYHPNDLMGWRLYIDPGHGGADNGASASGVLEDEINLNISLALAEQLVSRGAIIEISRTGDYDLASLYASNRKREDLRKRAEAMKLFQPDLFISIHVNSYPSSNVSGAQVFYRSGDEESHQAADFVQEHLNILNKTTKKAKTSDFYFFNRLTIKGILVECGFITNYSDRKKLLDAAHQQALAGAIADGVADFLHAF